MDSHDKAFILVTVGLWVLALGTFAYTILDGWQNSMEIFSTASAVTAMKGTLSAARLRQKKKRSNLW